MNQHHGGPDQSRPDQARPDSNGYVEPDTDEQLIAAFVRGSPDAFNTLFTRYRQPVFGFFCRRTADRSQAEELAQETFLAVVQARDRYEPTASFRTYLYAIALRILRTHRRKTSFRAVFQDTAPPDYEPATRVTLDVGIALRQAMGKLAPMEWEILLLREYEELSYAEIAEVLPIPFNSVRSRLFRARMQLRELLAAPPSRTATSESSKMEEHA